MDKSKPMKEDELRAHADCALCRKKILHGGIPLFWTVTLERFGVKLDAARRQDGLAMMLNGNAFLARHMGTNEDMAVPVMEPVRLAVCESCAVGVDQQTGKMLRMPGLCEMAEMATQAEMTVGQESP